MLANNSLNFKTTSQLRSK